MRQAKFVVALAAAASACPLHDLAEALEAGRAAAGPHDWPYAAACAAYANTTEVAWCGAGVRNSSGFAALAAAAGPRAAYVVAADGAGAALEDRPSQRACGIVGGVELKRREIGHRRRRGDSAAADEDDGRSPDSVLFGAPRFGARLPARFGDGRSAARAESEELLSVDGSAPTSPV